MDSNDALQVLSASKASHLMVMTVVVVEVIEVVVTSGGHPSGGWFFIASVLACFRTRYCVDWLSEATDVAQKRINWFPM